MIGLRQNVRTSSSNFGCRIQQHTRQINGRTYKFSRFIWRDGRTELWASPVGTKRGSFHKITGWTK